MEITKITDSLNNERMFKIDLIVWKFGVELPTYKKRQSLK